MMRWIPMLSWVVIHWLVPSTMVGCDSIYGSKLTWQANHEENLAVFHRWWDVLAQPRMTWAAQHHLQHISGHAPSVSLQEC